MGITQDRLAYCVYQPCQNEHRTDSRVDGVWHKRSGWNEGTRVDRIRRADTGRLDDRARQIASPRGEFLKSLCHMCRRNHSNWKSKSPAGSAHVADPANGQGRATQRYSHEQRKHEKHSAPLGPDVGRPLTTATIAERAHVPEDYLAKILKEMVMPG